MRKSRLALLPLAILLPFACSESADAPDDPSKTDDSEASDADGGGDAASGGSETGGSASGGDGSGGEATGGMGGSVTTTGTVEVHVRFQHKDAVGARVMISSADGNFLRTVLTDASGNATLTDFPVGGYVTVGVENTSQGQYRLWTIGSVEDGASLRFGDDSQASSSDALPHVTGTFADSAPEDRTLYYRRLPYSTGNVGPGTLNWSMTAVDTDTAGELNLLITALNDSQELTALAYFTNLDYSGETIAPISITSESFVTNLGIHETNLTNTWEDPAWMTTYATATRHGSTYLTGYSPGSSPLDPAATTTLSLGVDPGFFDHVVVTARAYKVGDFSYSTHRHEAMVPAALGTTVSRNLTPADLPSFLDGVSVDLPTGVIDISGVATPTCSTQSAQALRMVIYGDSVDWTLLQPWSTSASLPEIDPVAAEKWGTYYDSVDISGLTWIDGDYQDFITPGATGDTDFFFSQLPIGTVVCESAFEVSGG